MWHKCSLWLFCTSWERSNTSIILIWPDLTSFWSFQSQEHGIWLLVQITTQKFNGFLLLLHLSCVGAKANSPVIHRTKLVTEKGTLDANQDTKCCVHNQNQHWTQKRGDGDRLSSWQNTIVLYTLHLLKLSHEKSCNLSVCRFWNWHSWRLIQ